MTTFIAECRRRRIFRVVALYIVGAWVVLQVTDLAFESWDIPSAALRYVWIGAILGFPVALVFGWRFDIVGGQILRTESDGVVADPALSRSDYVVLGALAMSVLGLVFLVGIEVLATRAPQFELAGASIDPKSIAVLPFKNMSPEKDGAGYLASGIQDDLLTRLSKIAALKVISRTSVERYRGTTKTVRRIGSELGVGRVLEGGVQRDGEQIRINVQLIDTLTDEHIWAETYDRDLTATNVFAVQSEIVETIVRQMRASLTPEETQQLTAMPTKNLAAYTAYLTGKNHADVESVESLRAAIDSFNQAVSLDADFALAYVGLADAYLTLGVNFLGGLPTDESNALAEPPLVRALQLDGNLGQAYATLGLLRQQQGNWQAAEQAYEKAILLQPNYARVFLLYGRMRSQQGRNDEAMELLQKALNLDPYSAPVNFSIARRYDLAGDFEEALARYQRVIEIEPDHAFAYVYIAAIYYLVYGRADESLVWYHKAAENDALSPSLQAAQAIAYLELGDPESAREWVDKGLELGPGTFWAVWSSAFLNLYVGDDTAALRDARTLLAAYPRNWMALSLLRNADLEAGRNEIARSRYARSFSELTDPEIPQVDSSNFSAAIDLALVLIRLGEQARADDLLDGSLEAISTLQRLGDAGYWIADVRIYALQQHPQRALDALQQAIDEGWRFLAWWHLQYDPNLDSIRSEPRFQRLNAELQRDLAVQVRRVQELKASGDLS